MKDKREKIPIPLLVVQPGYFVATVIFGVMAVDVLYRFGPLPASLVGFAALALPLLSYVRRTSNPRDLLVDTEIGVITLNYLRFGRRWHRSYDLRRFRGVYWSIFNDRFPTIDLRLKGNHEDIRILRLDYSGRRDIEDVPEAMVRTASLLVHAGLEDMNKKRYLRGIR